MIKLHLRFFLACLCLLPITNVMAEQGSKDDQPLYQVEIIAFSIADNEALNSNEHFPIYPALPDYENMMELQDSTDNFSLAYRLLPRNKMKLNQEENLISKKNRYQVLFHKSWLQQVGKEKKVHLSNEYQDENIPSILNGTIKIKRGYYYYVDINLDFMSSSSSNQHYVLNSQRKLKSNELNYVDHPKFGLLIEIYPITKKLSS